jgi:hypothetical protein
MGNPDIKRRLLESAVFIHIPFAVEFLLCLTIFCSFNSERCLFSSRFLDRERFANLVF